ncbi:hypothetical protein [Lysobacter gummosus]|uniref:hypothetical protein n=1 Tax=Lysobacter gummosus TaxID=262324 RepID=UPI00363AE375
MKMVALPICSYGVTSSRRARRGCRTAATNLRDVHWGRMPAQAWFSRGDLVPAIAVCDNMIRPQPLRKRIDARQNRRRRPGRRRLHDDRLARFQPRAERAREDPVEGRGCGAGA